MEDRLVSVIIPHYNHGVFLEERIISVLAQLPSDGEVICVDDGSTDDSREIVARVADKRLRVMYNRVNQGVVAAATRGAQCARGKYLAFFGADDRVLPHFFEKTLGVLEAHPEVPLCCSDCGLLYDQYKIQNRGAVVTMRLLQEEQVRVFGAEEVVDLIRERRFWIPGHTAIVKNETFRRFGGLKAALGPKCDWFLLHSIALEEGVGYIPETLALWRRSGVTYSSQLYDPSKRTEWYKHMMEILSLQPILAKKFIDAQLMERF